QGAEANEERNRANRSHDRRSNCLRAVLSMEHRPLGLCAQRVSKPTVRSNSRRDNVSGVKLPWAHRLKVRVPAFQISILPECGFPCETRQLNFRVIEVRYERGVFLPQQNLWLDPWEAKDFAFVSHAHSDHIAPHRQLIVSERTGRLMQARLPGKRKEIILPFGQEKDVRGMQVTLFPAGHIFGSAQFFLRTENDSLLYI